MKTLRAAESGEPSASERLLGAAMNAFTELGYAATSTLEIATRAQVSKRELYALFGNKQAMLTACVADRAGRMTLPPELPAIRNREGLAAVLTKYGATVLREIFDPAVVAVFRLAVAEAQRAPEVARTLETARTTVRDTMRKVVAQAQSAGLLGRGDAADMASQYQALLSGDVMMSVLLCVRDAPGPAEIDRRARNAATAFLKLHPEPETQRRAKPT